MHTRTALNVVILTAAIAVSAHPAAGQHRETPALPASGDAPTTPPESSSAPSGTVQSVEALLQEADRLRMAGYYERAVEAYSSLARPGDNVASVSAPADEDARLAAILGLARCRLETGRYAEGLAELAAAADSRPVANRGNASARWHLLNAGLLARIGKEEEALEHARSAVQRDGQLCSARLALGQLLERLGRREEAVAEYEWFDRLVRVRLPDDAESLTAAGQGLYRYSVLTRHPALVDRTRHVLNKMFQAAYVLLDENYWPARVAAGDLLHEKYNIDQAAEDYKAALLINSAAADAHVGLGMLALEKWDFEGVDQRVTWALRTNPNHCGALRLRATSRIVEGRFQEALELCDQALSVNPQDVEAMALKAAAYLGMYDREAADKFIARADALRPHSAETHRILGEALRWRHQYAEAEAHYRIATQRDPTAAQPLIELGLLYMAWGEERKGREVLEAAWNLDEFNARTWHTLSLLERMAEFATIETEHFIVRYDREGDEIVGPLFAECLERMYAPICAAFAYEPSVKTMVEFFPTYSEFGVRVSGEPGIHALGVCMGRVIVMGSPRFGPDLQGPYHFEKVLRHEFTHTVTLGATGNLIPRWFTEGLAVLQMQNSRSFRWKHLLSEAVRKGEIFGLAEIDWRFMRPRRANDVQQAYAQSAWMCEHLAEIRGEDIITRMLAAFDAHQPQAKVFENVVGMTEEEFDRVFADWARQEAGSWGSDLTPPEDVYKMRALALVGRNDPAVQARLALAEADADHWDKALDAARRSVELDGENNPMGLEALVRVLGHHAAHARSCSEGAAYVEELEAPATRLLELDPDNRFALKALAQIELKKEAYEAALPHLLKLKGIRPVDPLAWSGLAKVYRELGRYRDALPELLLLAEDDSDHLEPRMHIGDVYERIRDLASARDWFQRALLIAPASPEPHARLARVLMQMGDTSGAIEEYRKLCVLAPQEAEYHTQCALAYNKLGDREKAREFARKAVKLDADSAAASLLEE